MKWTLEASSAAKETYGVPMGRAADGWMWWFKLYLHKLYQMHFTPVTGEADQGPKTKESSNLKSAHFPWCLSLNEVMGRVDRWTSLALSFSDSPPVDTAGTDGTSCSNLCKPHWAPQKYNKSTPTTEPPPAASRQQSLLIPQTTQKRVSHLLLSNVEKSDTLLEPKDSYMTL